MNCSEWQINISAYLDGAIEEEKQARLLNHLQECSLCHDLYEEHQQVNQMLIEASIEISPPGRIWERIAARIEKQTVVEERSWWADFCSHFEIPQLAYGFAALLLFGLASLFALQMYEDFSTHPEYLAELDSFTVDIQGNPFLEDMKTENPFWDNMVSRDLLNETNPFERYEEVMR